MPKCYSKQERESIKQRLKEEASKCLALYGIKKTTVDELVKRVNIPKGTFYLFYESKELLLFEVILEQHELIESQMAKALSSLDPSSLKEDLTKLIIGFYNMASSMPMIKMLTSSEIELLVKKLPQEVISKHLGHDDSMIDGIFKVLPVKNNLDVAAFSAAFRALFFATLHKEEIGEENYNQALYLLVNGLVSQII